MRKQAVIFALLTIFLLSACAKKVESNLAKKPVTFSSPCKQFLLWPKDVSEMPEEVISTGSQLYEEYMCNVCHGTLTEPDSATIGPSLIGLEKKWDDPVQYLYESILYPNDYIAPDCPTGPCAGPPSAMRQTYAFDIKCDELAALIAYILDYPEPLVSYRTIPDRPYYYHSDGHNLSIISVSRPESHDLLADWPVNVEALPKGDVARGEEWFVKIGVGCITCHEHPENLYVDQRGPKLFPIPFQEGDGMTLEQFIYESILYPDVLVISGFFAEPMPPDWGDRLSQQQVADLISFIMAYQE